MKKFFTLIFCLVSLGASAQQVNGGFDETWENCVPWTSKNNTSTVGTQPVDWCVSNVYANVIIESTINVASESTGYNGSSKAVTLTNKQNSLMKSQYIPAYMTLGTAWNTATVSGLISITISKQDGGCFGGKPFTNKPDGIKFYYQRSHGTADTDEPAVVTAYLWKGTWTQKSVPGNVGYSNSISSTTMTNRDRNILGMEPTATGGTVSKTDDAKLLAYLKEGDNKYVSIMGDASEWTEFTYNFTYDDTESEPEMINIIIAANDYFGGATAVGNENSITVDNVELIYNSSLSDLRFNGTTISDFAKDTYEYTIDDAYTEGCIEFTKDCVGGKVEKGFNPSSNSYIITVKGDDYDSNPSNTHTYTVKFTKVLIEDGVTDITKMGALSSRTFILKRTFKAGWNTICLPFRYLPSDLGENVKLYKLENDNNGTLEFNAQSNRTTAHIAYLAYFPETIEQIIFTGKSSTASPAPKATTVGDWTFIGSYKPSISMEGQWGVVNAGGKVRKGGAGSTMKGTRAYLTYNGSASTNEMRFIIDDAETNITEIDGEPLSYDVYNLNGMLVRKNATDLNGLRKGIYIVNGKKYIVK